MRLVKLRRFSRDGMPSEARDVWVNPEFVITVEPLPPAEGQCVCRLHLTQYYPATMYVVGGIDHVADALAGVEPES